MKIVINSRYGGFGLSFKAQKEYLKLIGKDAFFYAYEFNGGDVEYQKIYEEDRNGCLFSITLTKDMGDAFGKGALSDEDCEKDYFSDRELERDESNLISIVESLGEESNGWAAGLKVVEIPDDVDWTIEEYDGNEWIAEKHRTWS